MHFFSSIMKENYFEEHVNKFTNYKIIFYFNLLANFLSFFHCFTKCRIWIEPKTYLVRDRLRHHFYRGSINH